MPAVAGIAFAVLYGIALAAVPALPGIDKPGLEIVTYINAHATAMRTQALLLTFGSLALVVVMAHARDRLHGPYAFMFTIGSAVVLVQLTIATWFTGGLALHPTELGSGTARTLADVATMFAPVLTAANIMVAVPILLAANDGRFPRWVGIAAAVFAVEQLLETITIIGPPGSFISPGGPMNYWLGGPLFILFFLALGVSLSLPEDWSPPFLRSAPAVGPPADAPESAAAEEGAAPEERFDEEKARTDDAGSEDDAGPEDSDGPESSRE